MNAPVTIARITPSAQIIPKTCPWCGFDPLIPRKTLMGEYIVGCENEDCDVQPTVSATTEAEAWRKWNSRIPATATQDRGK